MLILTRRVGEAVMIGDDIEITILGVKGNQVRLGTNAPPEIPVHREEIYRKIKEEARRATRGVKQKTGTEADTVSITDADTVRIVDK